MNQIEKQIHETVIESADEFISWPRESLVTWPCKFSPYPEKYEKKYGFLKPVVDDVVDKYLDGGDLTKGFAV